MNYRKAIVYVIKTSVVYLILGCLSTGCQKEAVREKPVNPPPPPDTTITFETGIFVLNEGNFNWGNASVTFINNTLEITEQDIFKRINGRNLGDVAQSMKIIGNLGFIVVNNSNRIEVVNLKDFTSQKTITGFNYPRYLEIADNNKAYVTNLRKDITVIDLNSLTIIKSIKTPFWTEQLIRYKNLMFVTCYGEFNQPNSSRKSQVYIIDTKEDRIIDSIMTGKEPSGIVLDFKEKMWILTSGGYDHVEPPTLIRVDPSSRLIEKIFTFTHPQDLPSRLCINPTRDTLYFLNNGIFQMPVSSQNLPSLPLIPSEGRLLYGLNIHPVKGTIYVTDAIDYVQNGVVYQYSSGNGTLIKTYQAERIPAYICFTPDSNK